MAAGLAALRVSVAGGFGPLQLLRNHRLLTLMLGHFTVDSYVGVLPVLFPLLIGHFHLKLATVGLVSLAYVGMSAVSQPLFGLIADRWGTRFTGMALVWTAITFAAAGFAPTFPILVAVAALSGLGSGWFHPLGALTARSLLPERGTNTAMSVYVTGGTLGTAAGPLIGVLAFAAFGQRGTAALLPWGLAIAAFLMWGMRSWGGARGRDPARKMGPAAAVAWLPLGATIGVMASRVWTITSLQVFTPTWYHQLGYQPWFYAPLVTVMVLASAMGNVGAGGLADRFGRRAVILGTLVLSVPAVALFVLLPGPLGFLWGILVGALAASTAPLTLIIAQELVSGRAGFVSGLIMGMGFITGAVGVPITGALADHFGIQVALGLQVLVVVATLPVALLLPSEATLRRSREAWQIERPVEAESRAVGARLVP